MANEIFYKMVDGVVMQCSEDETAKILADIAAANTPEALYQSQRTQDKVAGKQIWEDYRQYITLQNASVDKISYLAANYPTIYLMLQDGVVETAHYVVANTVQPDGVYLTQADIDYFLNLFPII